MEKKRGRPKMAKSERRTEIVQVPLSSAERRLLEGAATSRGSPLAVWIRMVALEAAGKGQTDIGRE